jgi:hypothetical protein
LSNSGTREISLASNWPVSKVEDSLKRRAKSEIIEFLRERHEERFFDPIRHLTSSRGKKGYGFAIMALCSLLIETIQSYRYGLPSTYERDLKRLGIPKAAWKNGKDAFKDFFSLPRSQALFARMDGEEFYSNIRNGLLHQAQTKGGWKINTDQPVLCDPAKKSIDRDKFSAALKTSFDEYLEELNRHPWTEDIWSKAEQKISWLIKMSL